MWRAIVMLAVCVVLILGAVAAAAAGAPGVVAWILLGLIVPCGVAGYRLASVARNRSRAEQAEMIARTEARLGRKLPGRGRGSR
jgi:hypothetical protein